MKAAVIYLIFIGIIALFVLFGGIYEIMRNAKAEKRREKEIAAKHKLFAENNRQIEAWNKERENK